MLTMYICSAVIVAVLLLALFMLLILKKLNYIREILEKIYGRTISELSYIRLNVEDIKRDIEKK